jgi:dipeptidyl aminopeptidase/acylaminoacyl peptidase
MMRLIALALMVSAPAFAGHPPQVAGERSTQAESYSVAQVMGYAFPSDLTASPQGDWIAWSSVQRGVRNIWIARGPGFRPRMLTSSRVEDGQELTNLAFSADGRYLVWTRGGDHGANWPAEGNLAPNPTSSPVQPKVEIWASPVDGTPKLIAEGDAPAPGPRGDVVAFERGQEIWSTPIDGSRTASRLFFARGSNEAPVWSPDGRMLAFVTTRGAHSYIGIYSSASEPIRYLAPSTSLDSMPRWSPDATKIVFVRRPGRGGAASPPLASRPQPWSIMVADVKSGDARALWSSPETLRGSYPRTEGGANLHWMAGNGIAFLSYEDGWPHLYSLSETGGPATRLTTGDFMVEFVTPSRDGRFLIYNANTGDKDDIDRRHLFRVAADGSGKPEAITEGHGIEWQPTVTTSGILAYFGSDARKPPMTFVRPLAPASPPATAGRAIDTELVPTDFPSEKLVVPQHVTYAAPDNVTVHAQVFKSDGGPSKRPAIVFVHGGPPRQMLLGWHYRFYYANAYAVNQYLASRGFIVLSVNYRLGIGYGYEFHQPPDGGGRGASEYQDVLAGAKYLQARPDVDGARIGIWGGSYGGYLVALALGRNSDVFAAGVDIHGVHNRAFTPPEPLATAAAVGDGVTADDLAHAAKVAWESSPDAHAATWRSPVLFIHGDDDRNVRVDQTVDLVQRLRKRGVQLEEMIIPDEIHDFLLYRNWLRVNSATAEFFERWLGQKT